MRSITLAGIPDKRQQNPGYHPRLFGAQRPTRGTALMNGIEDDLADFGEEVWDQASTFIEEQAIPWLLDFLDFGPSYDPGNGGELSRQMEANGWLGQPWCNAYMAWLKANRPKIWSGEQDVWTSGDPSSPSSWRTIYNKYLAAGMPDGALLDANMVPIGFAQLQAAVHAANEAHQGTPSLPPLSAATMNALNLLVLDYMGANGAQAQQVAKLRVGNLPKNQMAYFLKMVAIWKASNTVHAGGGAQQAGTGLLMFAGVVGAAMLLSNSSH